MDDTRSCITVDDYDDTPVFTRDISVGRIKSKQEARTSSQVQSYYSNSMISILKNTETKDTSKPIRYRVSLLLSNMFATILEDVLTQIHLVAECNNQIRLYTTKGDMASLRRAKYSVEIKSVPEAELDVTQHKNLDCESFKLSKLVNDRIVCYDVLTETYLNLALNRSYEPLIMHRKHAEEIIDHRLFMVDEEAKNKEECRELRRKLRQQRNRIKSNVYETNLVIERLTSDVENSAVFKSAEKRYSEKWQVARSEQHSWKLNDKETKVTRAISLYRNKFDEEQRVHTELENIMKITICELLQKIEERMNIYEKDMESIELKITQVRINYEKQLELREKLEETFGDHQRVIDSWLQYKEDREKQRLYKEHMTNAAIAVQAWWRGLLVRLELGPYSRRMQRLMKKKGRKNRQEMSERDRAEQNHERNE